MIQSATVVMPAYRATATLGTALQSLLDQTDRPDFYEIIVVDDASQDETAVMAEAFIPKAAALDIDLRVYRMARNGGPAKARNAGAAGARGEIIIFTDSDCELTPTWLREMRLGYDDPDVAAVKGAYLSRQTELGARFAQAELEERYALLEKADYIDVVFSYSAAFRREVFTELGGFDTRFPVADNEDTDLSWRLIEAGHRAVFRPEAKLYHRHMPSLYQYYRKKVSRGYWRMVVYRRFPGKAVKDSYTPQSLKLQILLAYLSLPALLLSPLNSGFLMLFWACIGIFFLTTLPFAAHTLRKDPLIGLLSPILLFGRAIAIGAGVLMALPRIFRADALADPDSDTNQA